MTKLKNKLIKLGSQEPSLRRNIKPVLDHLEKTSNLDSNESIVSLRKKWCHAVFEEVQREIGGQINTNERTLELDNRWFVSITFESYAVVFDVFRGGKSFETQELNFNSTVRETSEVILMTLKSMDEINV